MDLRDLEIYDLRCFVAVATRLNFTQAARDLHISTSPLSRRIKEMERLMNTKLFERDTRTVTLTSAGAKLLPAAQQILDQFEKLPEAVLQGTTAYQSMTYGVPHWLHADLQKTLTLLQEIHGPRIRCTKWPRGSNEITAAILGKELVFGFIRPTATPPGLTTAVIREEQMAAVLSRSDFGSHKSVSIRDLLKLSYIADRRDTDTEYRREVEGALESAGTLRLADFAPGDLHAAGRAIARGEAFEVVPLDASGTNSPYSWPETVCLPIEDLDFTLATCLAWNTSVAESDDAAGSVIDTAIALFRQTRTTPVNVRHTGLSRVPAPR